MNEESEFDELAPWLVIIITLIGGALRVFLLGNKGLRIEEAFSMWVSNHTIAEITQWITKIDQHPPLYYLLLHFWTALNGNSTYNLRLFSTLFSTATIPVIYLIGKRMSGVAMGLAAAAFLALSPFNIRLAHETRMYTLLEFNAAVAIYALVRLLTDSRSVKPIGSQFKEYIRTWRTLGPVAPDPARGFSYADTTRNQTGWRGWIYRHRWLPIQTIETDLAWVVFTLFSAATMLSHGTGFLFPLATNIFVLGLLLFQRNKDASFPPLFQAPSFWNWVKAQIGIFLLCSPWIVGFIKQASRVFQEFWIPRPGWNTLIQTLNSLLNEFRSGQAGLSLVIWFLYALVLCLGLLQNKKKFSQILFLATLFAIPLLTELVFSIRRPIFLDRTLIWTTIPLILVLAAGIAQLRFRALIVVVVGILGTVNLFSISDYYKTYQEENWGKLAGIVANYVQKDDLILFSASRAQIPFDYYFKAYVEQYYLEVEEHGVPADLFDSGSFEPKMTESDISRLTSLLNGHKRVWLIYKNYQNTDPQGLIPQTLSKQMALVQKSDAYGVQIQFYMAP